MLKDPLKQRNKSPDQDDSFQTLNMPIYKSNKRIFLNELEKYTSNLLTHLEDLDFDQPKELSQITDVLSDDKSERKELSPNWENNRKSVDKLLQPIDKRDVLPYNFYYESKGYKNYKYKLFKIDLDEIGKCQKLGKKFDAEKYLDLRKQKDIEKFRSLDVKLREKKKKKENNLLILSKKYKKYSDDFDNQQENDLLEQSKNKKSFLPKITPSRFSQSNEENSKSEKIIEKITSFIKKGDKEGYSLIKFDKNTKNASIVENYSFENLKTSTESDYLTKIQINYLNIAKIIKKFTQITSRRKERKYAFESKKEKNVLTEFIYLSTKSENFVVDSKNPGFYFIKNLFEL